jgi:ribonucleoside-diphosphate reductase alpha chain
MAGKLNIERYFSHEGVIPYDEFEWEYSNVDIKDERGNVIFVQKNSEFPKTFSPNARSVVASRYAYGQIDTEERETSLKSIIGRVSETYGKQALKHGYFDEKEAKIFTDEIAKLTLDQRVAFNSPVWFNVGVGKYASRINSQKSDNYHINEQGIAVRADAEEGHLYPQTAACFIQSVEDTMESIMQLATNEAMLFKYGSGTGTDLSPLRSSREKLSGGGKPSGPMAYEKFYDAVAGIVKSGGKTRRAAKMNSLKVWHPDIKEFIIAKSNEEKKALALVEEGYDPRTASETVAYQNANLSVRVSDDFMLAVKNDEEWRTRAVHNHELDEAKNPDGSWVIPRYKAKELMKLIAEGTWLCGDPGLQYHDTINRWHTCPNSGPINASNPCSEYMFLDDTSCNLASFNLRKFQKKEGGMDILSYEKGIETIVTAMDLNYYFSGFPTEKIAQNSFDNRTLGVGYANLGAFLMSGGLSYDSDEGRAVAAAITSLTAAKVYEASTILAEKFGTFKNFDENKEPMLNVMEKHRNAARSNDLAKLPERYMPVYKRALELWDSAIERGKKFGFRNAQGVVLAPTGTIGFMMDCDTNGVEPDTALVKYKKLSEGGLMRIVNQSVPDALRKLKYDDGGIEKIINYIDQEDTIEGAPGLKEEHLPVFDCALKPKNGKRFLPWQAHIKMMASVQPYLSGAISKTVNMPEESTVEDIENAYMMGWELGLKALAIYRDGSKAWQVVQTGKGGLEKRLSPKKPAKRVKLPIERESITHKFTIADHDIYATIGLYDDKKPGELFLTMSKEGSTMSGMMDSFATMVSISLQHGVPLKTLVDKFTGTRFEPSGFVQEGYKDIPMTKSIMDYLFRYMGYKFIKDYGKNKMPVPDLNGNGNDKGNNEVHEQSDSNNNGQDGAVPKGPKADVFCSNCGDIGHTYKLGNCNILCDKDFGGCGFMDQKGCSG